MEIDPRYWLIIFSTVTTVDKNDALCSDVTIPWEWLEGPDLGLVEEPEHVEDDGLEG